MISLPLREGSFLIDNSFLEVFATCPRACLYNNLYRRQLASIRPALLFGSAGHRVWDWRYSRCLNEPPSEKVENEQRRILEWFFKKNVFPEDDWRNLNWAVEVFIKQYNRLYTLEPWNIVVSGQGKPMVEVPFIFPIYMHRRPNGDILPVFYTGKIDLLVRWEGRLVAIDHKTTSVLGDMFWDDKKVSPQFFGYAWAAWKITGEVPSGFCVNAVRSKAAPLKPKGGMDTWWLENFERQKFWITEDDLREWELNTIELIKLFLHMAEEESFPQYRYSCRSKYGKCQFYDVCTTPPSQRGEMLSSGNFQDNVWSPLD